MQYNFSIRKIWEVVAKTPIQVRQTCHHKTGMQKYLSSPQAKSWSKLPVLDILGMEILIVQTPTNLLWTWPVGAPQLTSSKATSLPKVSHPNSTSDANEAVRKAQDDGLDLLVEAVGKARSLVPVPPVLLAAWPLCWKAFLEHRLLEESCGNPD